jgi:hypothetical protein
VEGPEPDLLQDLSVAIPKAALVPSVQAVLGLTRLQAEKIVEAFDDFVATPMKDKLAGTGARDLAKRNVMIYTVRGVRTVEEWVDRVLEDKETSAIETHLGTWQEEVARIVSGGFKPGSGVDLQVEDDGHVDLYAIQASPNTKNAGGRAKDVDALRLAAKPLRAAKRTVDLNVAVLSGRDKTGGIRAAPDVTVLGSDDFWERITGIPDFRARLFKASMILSPLVRSRAGEEVVRIKEEARKLFGDADGGLDIETLANPPKAQRKKRTKAAAEGQRALPVADLDD